MTPIFIEIYAQYMREGHEFDASSCCYRLFSIQTIKQISNDDGLAYLFIDEIKDGDVVEQMYVTNTDYEEIVRMLGSAVLRSTTPVTQQTRMITI